MFTRPELLAAAAARGCHLRQRQFEVWVKCGLLPRPRRRGLGRGRGSRTEWLPETVELMVAATAMHRRHRPLATVGMLLWLRGWPVDLKLVRRGLLRHLRIWKFQGGKRPSAQQTSKLARKMAAKRGILSRNLPDREDRADLMDLFLTCIYGGSGLQPSDELAALLLKMYGLDQTIGGQHISLRAADLEPLCQCFRLVDAADLLDTAPVQVWEETRLRFRRMVLELPNMARQLAQLTGGRAPLGIFAAYLGTEQPYLSAMVFSLVLRDTYAGTQLLSA